MHECPCCSECVYSDDPDDLCSCCEEAGCEAEDDKRSDNYGYYVDCQIPQCGECETRATFCTDGKWHDNCEPDECSRKRSQEGKEASG